MCVEAKSQVGRTPGTCAKPQKGLPDGQGGEAAPPGQIGRMKLFEAGRCGLTGLADG